MSQHLLVMSVGPVQAFIAQARRTRDLWFGSELLSRLSQHLAALVPADSLVFPSPTQSQQLSTGAANKVVALVSEEPRALAARAREALRGVLVDEGLKAFDSARQGGLVSPEYREAAREQLATFLEFHAAWAPWDGSAEGYAQALAQAEEAIGGRKALHTFSPWRHQRGAHKSSLDGARETVLLPGPREGGKWKRFRIGQREELDALGLLKRTGGDPEQFIPLPTLGLATWTQTARREAPEAFQRLVQACKQYALPRLNRDDMPWVKHFPYDAQVLLPERCEPYFRDCGLEGARAFEREAVAPLMKALPAPYPYVACLVADGDRMGQTLQQLARHGPEAHRRLSRALSDFTVKARALVEGAPNRGLLVYAGGDDVLAFVCLPDAPRCAEALRQAFSEAVEEALREWRDVPRPTLSVGLGVGHVLEALGELLTLGRQAEIAAKQAGRDALAIRTLRHSTRELEWTASWKDNPVRQWEDAARLLSRGLPLGKVHQVGEMWRRLPSPGDSPAREADWARLLRGETQRLLAHTESGMAPLHPEDVGLDWKGNYQAHHAALGAWVQRMLVAETLVRAGWRADAGGDT